MTKAYRIRELDGLRALAILPVLMLHFAPLTGPLKWLGSIAEIGWIGVDLFFVLSGYLITGILLDSVSKPHYYKYFIIRRALRILPLYYLCLALFTAAAYIHPGSWRLLLQWGNPLWFVFYVGNIRLAMHNAFPPIFAFDPLWSLQVEEQFYLLYPVLVASCRIETLRKVLIGCVVLAALLRCLTVVFIPGNGTACYVLTPFRMDSLALGGLIAVFLRSGGLPFSATALRSMFIALATACAIMFMFISRSMLNPFVRSVGYSIIALAWASLLAFVISSPHGISVRVLRWFPLVYAGQLAYGLYLLHAPAAAAARSVLSRLFPLQPHDSLDLFISIPVTFAAAALSWKLLESRMIALKDHFAPPLNPLPGDSDGVPGPAANVSGTVAGA